MKEINGLNDLKGFTGLVLFGSHTCAPCRTYKPVLERFCERLGINLGYVDAGKRPDLAGTYGVRAVPTTFFYVNGSPFSQRQGAQTEAALMALLPDAR
jgi:thioredoxin-like negative regulator of GroEL